MGNNEKHNKGGHKHYNRRRNKNFNNKPKANNPAEGEEVTAPQAEVAAEVQESAPKMSPVFNRGKQNQPVAEVEEEPKYMFDYEAAPLPKDEEAKNVEVVGIKFRNGSKIYYFAPNGISFEKGEHAIVETVRGVEYGDVALGNKMVGESEVVFPLKPVLRKATAEDEQRNAENRKLEESAKPIWHEKVKKNGLEMQLVDVEYTHDNAKLSFYFTADGRVDFRELVKDLAGVFRTRIELRQIGVRDEAKLFGGLGSCGRPFFLYGYTSMITGRIMGERFVFL